MIANHPGEPRSWLLVDEVGAADVPAQSRPERLAKIVLTLAMWAASYGIFTLGAVLAGRDHIWFSAGIRAILVVVGLAVCLGLHLLIRRFAHRRFRTRVMIAAAVAPITAELYAWANYFIFEAVQGHPLRFVINDWYEAVHVLSLWTWFFIAWTGLYLAIEYSFEARREAWRAAELRELAHAAKLQALSSQINPHFLYNSLNSISALILDGKGAEAELMLSRLSGYFRSTLSLDALTNLTIAEELDLHRSYLAIEQVRFPDLAIDIALPDALRAAEIPALLIQPLVENAVKHGVANSLPPTKIRIAAEQRDGALSIMVADHGHPLGERRLPDKAGIGIANVRQRLKEYFGAAQSLELFAAPDRFEARITMPLRYRA